MGSFICLLGSSFQTTKPLHKMTLTGFPIHLEQGSSNSSQLSPVFVNKVLLEHRHASFSIFYVCFHASVEELSG